MEIDYKTSIPLFVAIGVVPAIVVAVFWIATVSARVSASEQRSDKIVDKIHVMEARGDRVLDGITDLRERLARIEEKLKKE